MSRRLALEPGLLCVRCARRIFNPVITSGDGFVTCTVKGCGTSWWVLVLPGTLPGHELAPLLGNPETVVRLLRARDPQGTAVLTDAGLLERPIGDPPTRPMFLHVEVRGQERHRAMFAPVREKQRAFLTPHAGVTP